MLELLYIDLAIIPIPYNRNNMRRISQVQYNMMAIITMAITYCTCISKVVYLLSEKFSIARTFVNNYEILTIIHKTDDDFDVNDFWDKMNDFKLREIINIETKDIKTILYAKAFGEFDNLDENDFD